jgi:hypothetical protein
VLRLLAETAVTTNTLYYNNLRAVLDYSTTLYQLNGDEIMYILGW